MEVEGGEKLQTDQAEASKPRSVSGQMSYNQGQYVYSQKSYNQGLGIMKHFKTYM